MSIYFTTPDQALGHRYRNSHGDWCLYRRLTTVVVSPSRAGASSKSPRCFFVSAWLRDAIAPVYRCPIFFLNYYYHITEQHIISFLFLSLSFSLYVFFSFFFFSSLGIDTLVFPGCWNSNYHSLFTPRCILKKRQRKDNFICRSYSCENNSSLVVVFGWIYINLPHLYLSCNSWAVSNIFIYFSHADHQ